MQELILETIVYHLFRVEVEFHKCVFLSYLKSHGGWMMTFEDNLFALKNDVDEDLSNLGMGICYHFKELRSSAQCLVKDEDFVKRLRLHCVEQISTSSKEILSKGEDCFIREHLTSREVHGDDCFVIIK
nr:hypothetical protein [Tanacetum cinerariifolium]